MKTQTPFKRLILRAVLRKVSPMVIRVLALPDYLTLAEFDEVFCTPLGWEGIGFSIHIHGQEFTSFLRRTKVQRKTLQDFQLRPRETSLYSIHVEDSIFGNGSSGFWTRNQEVAAMRRRCAWQAVVRLHPNAAVAPRVIG